jgi:hypothetical protein
MAELTGNATSTFENDLIDWHEKVSRIMKRQNYALAR